MLKTVVLWIVVLLPVGLFWLMGRIVWTAISTGRFLARGAIYDRDGQPVRYYLGITVWILVFFLFTFISVGLLTHWPSS